MEILIQPKKQFQAFHGKDREQWSAIAKDHATQLAMTYGLAEMAALGFSQAEISGARTFMFLLLNLGEPDAPPMDQRYPAVPLKEPPLHKTSDQEQTTET